jgi:hypothetical protein
VRGVAHDPVLRAKLMARHQEGVPLWVLSAESGIARPVLSRWWARYQARDVAGLRPRSRRPHRSPSQHDDAIIEAIAAVRDFGWGVGRIADELGLGHGTVQRTLERLGRNRLPAPPRRPVHRYEKTRPGELLHLDYKYLPVLGGRAEFEYAAIDDFTREGAAMISGDRSTRAATRFLEAVLAQVPYRVEAVMTDNDLVFTMRFAYHAQRLTRFQQALKGAGIEPPLDPPAESRVERQGGTLHQNDRRRMFPHHAAAVVAGPHRGVAVVFGVLQSRAAPSEPGRRESRHATGRLLRPS